MTDRELDDRLDAYGARWRDAHPFSNDVDTAHLTRRARRNTLAAIAAVVVVVGVAVGVAAVVRNGGSSNPTPVSPTPSTRTTPKPTTTTTTTTGPSPAAMFPQPQPAQQVAVQTNQPSEPVAVGSRVWIGTPTGVDAFDSVTMHRVGHVPIALPVLEIATSSDGVWVLSGSGESLDPSQNPPYRLERIDSATLHVEFSKNLPYADGYRSYEHIRLVAVPGTAWLALGPTVLRVDTRTGAVKLISLSGHGEANIAADDSGLWVETDGTDGPHIKDFKLLHVDATTNAVTPIAGFPDGFYWSIATTPGAVWLLAATDETEPGLTLMRLDPETHAIRKSRVRGISLVSGDGQLWVQVFKPTSDSLNFDNLVGQIDAATGTLTRTVQISIGQVNGSSGDGYASPPFVVANGQIWSGYSGLQRTTLGPVK